MRRSMIVGTTVLLALASLAAARPFAKAADHSDEDSSESKMLSRVERLAFGSFGDSLGVRFLGSWPFGLQLSCWAASGLQCPTLHAAR